LRLTVFPVFRDRDELPLSADLGNALQDALRASRYLIVVCSERSANSPWVNEEIRYFGIDGKPTLNDLGVHLIKQEFNDDNIQRGGSFYGINE
jgi:MTH538 TIR-like domain (DUF1863)